MTIIDIEKHRFRSTELSIVKKAIVFFNDTPLHTLPPPQPFDGTGVYGIYYLGEFDLYSPLAKSNRISCIHPIYVGKAVPTGSRKGRARTANEPRLYGRLIEHKRSIAVTQLNLSEFRCRFMILIDEETDLIVPVESELIRIYRPLWNTIIDGFGNHDPGSGRYEQAKSEWDVLHEGRPWVNRLIGNSPQIDKIVEKIRKYFSGP